MDDKFTYRNTVYLLCLLSIVLIFLEFNNEKINDYIDLFEDIIFFAAYAFTLFWLKRIILFIGFIIYLISFNIELITNNTLPSVKPLYYFELYDLVFVLSTIGILLFFIGLSDKIKLGKLTNEINLSPINLFGFSILITLFLQTIIRL